MSPTPWGGHPAPQPCQPPIDWTAGWIDLVYNYVDASSHNNGNVVKITNNVSHFWSQNFTYDSLNRIRTGQSDGTISSGAGNCWAETYTIDAWGNLNSNAPDPVAQSAYNGCIQEAPANLTGVIDNNNRLNGMGFTTDAAGNLIADGVHTFTFDAENHLLSTAQTGQTTVTYKYDGDGKRVQKSSGTLYWYGLNGQPLLETTLTGSPSFAYYYFNGRITNRRPWYHVFNLDTYVPDALGNTRLVSGLSTSGAGAWDYSDYYPYGGEWSHYYMCCIGNHYKFTGKERDPESNLDNFEARYYSSNLGRFTSPDPDNAGASAADPQSWNAYSYALNNPINITDPDGTSPDNKGCRQVQSGDSLITICTSTTVIVTDQDPGPTPTMDVQTRNVVQSIGQAAGKANDHLNTAWTLSRLACVAGSTGLGALAGGYVFGTLGTVGGGGFGATVGLAGGPAAPVTVPAGAGSGALIGGVVGTVGGTLGGGYLGYRFGSAFCGTGGSGGGSGGRGGGGGSGTSAGRKVTFGHGARRLSGTGLGQAQVESAIESAIQSATSKASSTGSFWGKVNVNGQTILYRAHTLPDGTINVGTYFKP